MSDVNLSRLVQTRHGRRCGISNFNPRHKLGTIPFRLAPDRTIDNDPTPVAGPERALPVEKLVKCIWTLSWWYESVFPLRISLCVALVFVEYPVWCILPSYLVAIRDALPWVRVRMFPRCESLPSWAAVVSSMQTHANNAPCHIARRDGSKKWSYRCSPRKIKWSAITDSLLFAGLNYGPVVCGPFVFYFVTTHTNLLPQPTLTLCQPVQPGRCVVGFAEFGSSGL